MIIRPMVSRFLLTLGMLGVGVAGCHAQSPPTEVSVRVSWLQAAPDAATAGGYTFRRYDDGASAGTTLTGVACTGVASPFACAATYAITSGAHTIQITTGNSAGESVKAPEPPLAYNFSNVALPAAPTNLQIIQIVITTTTTSSPK